MYFSYDIIDNRAVTDPDGIAIRWQSPDGRLLEVSNADLHHHSDVTAYYLRRMGVGVGSRVFMYDMETVFEYATVLTALNKLCATPVFDLRKQPVERCNELQAYAVVCNCLSDIIPIIDADIDKFTTLEIKISVGYPYPRNWFDLHTGTRLARPFRPADNLPKNYTSFIVYDKQPILYDETYPIDATGNTVLDRFLGAIRHGSVFEIRQ